MADHVGQVIDLRAMSQHIVLAHGEWPVTVIQCHFAVDAIDHLLLFNGARQHGSWPSCATEGDDVVRVIIPGESLLLPVPEQLECREAAFQVLDVDGLDRRVTITVLR